MRKPWKICAAVVMITTLISGTQLTFAGQLYGSNGENRWFEVGATDGSITDINNSTDRQIKGLAYDYTTQTLYGSSG